MKYKKKKKNFFRVVVECKKKISFEKPRGGYFKSRESVDHRFMSNKNIGTVYFMLFIFYFLKIEKRKNTVRIFGK